MRYKDYPKHDMRRCFALLLTIEKLGARATMHYLSLELGCTRAEVARSVDVARRQLQLQIDKPKFAYEIRSWGVLSREAVVAAMRRPANDVPPHLATPMEVTMEWTRQTESDLVDRCINAARQSIHATSREDADLYRFSAQLVKTRYPDASRNLDAAAHAYFGISGERPRSFPQVVDDGLVKDVARLRHLIENRLAGVKTW